MVLRADERDESSWRLSNWRWLSMLAVGAAGLGMAHTAIADEKAVCVKAYEEAQRLRQESKLRAARGELLVCVRDVCAAVLRQDCDQWLREVDLALPSLVFAAKGPDGTELDEVSVTMDGSRVRDHLDGKAFEVDPGKHTFRFEARDYPVVEQQILVREGEKNRTLEIRFKTSATEPTSSTPSVDRPVPAGVYVLGAIGLIAAGSFAYFGLKGRSEASDLDKCKPYCDEADVSHVRGHLIAADVSLGISVATLGIATYLFLTRPEESKADATSFVPRLRLMAGPQGAIGSVVASF